MAFINLDNLVRFFVSKVYRNRLFRIIFVNDFLRYPRNLIYSIFNSFYFPLFYRSCSAQIKKLPPDTQVFVINRPDFGTFLVSLLYIRCWQKERGNTSLIILTFEYALVKRLAKLICPETIIIFPYNNLTGFASIFFGYNHVYHETLLLVYSRLISDYPNILFVFDQASSKSRSHCSNYVSFFDESIASGELLFSSDFCKAYKKTRKIMDYRQDIYTDFMHLYYKSDTSKRMGNLDDKLKELRSHLGMDERYVIININLKKYTPHLDEKKRIRYPERYNSLVDSLIEKGFTVVIQGRAEQPLLQSRKGLVNYARSSCTSVENDMALFSGCAFVIASKTGPEFFAPICNVPLLSLNYVELPSGVPNHKMRYYPKHVVDKRTGDELTWQEILQNPCFFDIGPISDPNVEYIDLEENEMINALEEFLPLIHFPSEQWLNFTDSQIEFKNSLHPMHLDLYHVKGMPCDCYLKSFKVDYKDTKEKMYENIM